MAASCGTRPGPATSNQSRVPLTSTCMRPASQRLRRPPRSRGNARVGTGPAASGSGGDDGREDDDVVLAGADRPVELPAAGDQRERGAGRMVVEGVREGGGGLVESGDRAAEDLQPER